MERPPSSDRTGTGGFAGVVVSTVMLVAGDAALDVPAGFVSVTVMAFVPLPRSGEGVNVHVPSGLTVVVPICVPLSNTLMVSPAVPLPLMCGCASAVVLPAGIAAPLSSVRLGAAGVAGVVVFTVILVAGDMALAVPAAFVSVTVKAFAPLPTSGDGLNVHVPSSATVVEPICVPLSNTLMMSPAVPLPLMCGCASAVVLPAGIAAPLSSVRLGAAGVAGVVVFAVILVAGDMALAVPAAFVSVTVKAFAPLPTSGDGLNVHVPSSATVVE